jgi:hypothetical protein
METDMFGDVNVYHRHLELTRSSAEEYFGKDKLPSTWYDEKDNLKDPFTEDRYIWSIYPNDDRDTSSKRSEDKPYLILIVMEASQPKKEDRLVYKKGRDRFIIAARSGRESGAAYGTSISADCLTAAQMVNQLGKVNIRTAHMQSDPPTVGSKSIRRSLQPNPGGRTWVDDIQREGIKPWHERLNWSVSDAQLERLYGQIEDRMFIRFFEMLSSGGDFKERTAYEISQMMAEKATLMTTMVDTFEQETLEPVIDTLFRYETDAGRMPDPPAELLEEGGRYDIRYLGPLDQLQKALLRGKPIVDSIAIIGQMMELDPKVGWKFNFMEMAEEAAVSTGLSQKFVHPDSVVEQTAAEAARQQQLAETAQALEVAGKAAPGLGQTPEEGSPAEALMAGVAEQGEV